MAFQRFLHQQDIMPLINETKQVGANLWRTFGQYGKDLGIQSALGDLRPSMYTPAQVAAFLNVLAENGLRCEWVFFADLTGEDGQPSCSLQEAQAQIDVYAEVLSAWNVLVELANEPFKNVTFDVYDLRIPAGWVWASGDYDFDNKPMRHGSYITYHTDRKFEWPRTPKSGRDIRDDMGGKCPVVMDEGTGAAELARGDSRSATPLDFAYYAACSTQHSAGATFHSDAGISSVPMGTVQLQCALMFFRGLTYIPAEAQFSPYRRGAAGNANLDNSVVHHDLEEGVLPSALRSYDSDVPDKGTWFNRIRAEGATEMNPGWTKDEEAPEILGLGKSHR